MSDYTASSADLAVMTNNVSSSTGGEDDNGLQALLGDAAQLLSLQQSAAELWLADSRAWLA